MIQAQLPHDYFFHTVVVLKHYTSAKYVPVLVH